MAHHHRTASVATGVVAVVAGMLLLAASPALADRTYDSQITGFANPWGIAVDSGDNVWVTDTGNSGLISEYSPSQTLLSTQTGQGLWGGGGVGGGFVRSLAVNSSNGYLYVADSNSVLVDVFDASGNYVPPQWGGFGGGYDYVAADNSGGASNGRVYVAYTPGTVAVFDPDHNPVNFSGSAPYISGNTITGTPSGSFGKVWNIATDNQGNIYVVDQGKSVVDEFDSTGIFAQAFTGAGAPGGFSNNLTGVAVDPTNGNVLVVDQGNGVVDEFDSSGASLQQLTGTPGGSFGTLNGGVAVDSGGSLYVSDGGNHVVDIFTSSVLQPKISYGALTNQTPSSATLNASVDPNGAGDITDCHFKYGTDTSYSLGSVPCVPAVPYSSPTDVSADISALTTETTYHYRVVLTTANGIKQGSDQTYLPHAVTALSTDPATNVAPTAATLNGAFTGEGADTHYYFEWGTDTSYGNQTAVPPGTDIPSPTGATAVHFDLGGLDPITTYHYRIVASNGFGTSVGADRSFTTPLSPPLLSEWVTDVHSDSALIHAAINPGGGGDTTYHFEWGTDTSYGTSVPLPDADVGSLVSDHSVSAPLSGLTAGTTYHFRAVAQNAVGTTDGPDHTFTTFPFTPLLSDPCPNAHVRQQTGSALLLDCRAYELVSAANTGGYDVESSLVGGQTPFGGYPQAESPSRVLYAVHDGGIPGTGNPTNRGVDPYLATRDPKTGWSTQYVGIPANGTPSAAPFGSPLAEADPNLDTFAFAGPGICSPCFVGGTTGVPVHLPDGSLVQGMAGSMPVANPVPAGEVKKPFSADGSHFVFGSEQQFEPAGNPDNGNVTIYDRNLKTGVTRVASTDTAGTALADGSNVAELDISSDGSRIVFGDLIGTDSVGNKYWHLYLHVEGSPNSIDLTPGTTQGVLYDGMTADGARVFFTSADKLLGSDTDSSADIYRADVAPDGTLTLHLVSIGSSAPSNSDSCDPVSNSARTHWNTVGSTPNCDAVAIGGGGGVGAGDGSVYFLSPEQLDGTSGALDQPNLYLARPGSAPHFIATLDPNDPAVLDAVGEAGTHRYADFQVTPSGDDAAFTSTLPLTGYDNAGHSEVYRYDAPSDHLDCASCPPTGAQASGDATLAAGGLGLADDGRVFFNSTEPLAPRDLDNHADAYEFSGGAIELISTGSSPFDSSLLGVSADGTDAYFFTRDVLVSQDENGQAMKIYDARAGGGFFVVPPRASCAAADECHGPGTQPPAPPSIHTVGASPGNVPPEPKQCKKGQVRKHGKCVKKHHGRSKKGRRANYSRGGAR